MALYKGFSFHKYRRSGTTKLSDVELVKQNLLTHIYTSLGERLMMSTFGTRIRELIHEPLTQDVLDIIQEDINLVCNYDPRIEKLELKLTPVWDEGMVLVRLTFKYIELNMTDSIQLNLEFDT